jgi:hypothetical protein
MTPDIRVEVPAVPTTGATVTLFDSSVALGKMGLRVAGIHRVTMAFPGLDVASATDGLIGYTSPNKGTTWYPCSFAYEGFDGLPDTVPVDSGDGGYALDVDVTPHDDVKFTFTAGATPPAVWKPVIILVTKRVSGV